MNRTKLASLGLGKIIHDDPAFEGPPRVSITGFSAFGNATNSRAGMRTTLDLIDNMSWTHGRHLVKFGGNVRSYRVAFEFGHSDLQWTSDGSGTTNRSPLVTRIIPGLPAALNDFANGYALTFTQGSSARSIGNWANLHLFVQDDWKVRPNFTINAGLRWEFNKSLVESHDRAVTFRRGQQSVIFPDAPVGQVYPGDAGIPRATIGEDWNNFGPRLGFAWDARGNGKLSVRGGYGLLFGPRFGILALGFGATPYIISPTVRSTLFANPWEGAESPLRQPFPFHPPKPGERFDFTQLGTISLVAVPDPHAVTPYTNQWNFQIQSQIRKDWLVELGYAGSASRKVDNTREGNPAISGPGATTQNLDQRRILNIGNLLNGKFGGAVFGRIPTGTTDGNATFHSLQANLTRRFSNGFQMAHAYTWGHSIDDTSSTRDDNWRANRGDSDHDVRHRYVMTYLYELPFFRQQPGLLGRLAGGWGMSGIVSFQTGLPFDITEPNDRCLCGNSGGQRPDYVGGEVVFLDPRSTTAVSGRPNSWFDGTGGGSVTGAPNPYFRRVGSGQSYALGAGRFGNLGSNAFHGPGSRNWEAGVFKRIKVTEGQRLDFRAEFSNVLNHANFANPASGIGNANFGRIQNTRDPRIVQMSLRYTF